MAQRAEYRIITGTGAQLQQEMAVLAVENWTPILMSSTGTESSVVVVTIVLEHLLPA